MKNDPTERAPLTPGGPEELAHLRAHGNGLRDAASLYLRQHAHNPLDWRPWGDEALERARREDKPIFLSIGYSACHWCHVMEHEVFEHDDVAAFMNAHFVCIKVDREERPDLDAAYMDAVVAMTGRGGWPMSVFLTPDLKPFHGGTYYPRDVFLQLVRQVDAVYRGRREDIDRQGAQLVAAFGDPLAAAGAADSLDAEAPGDLVRRALDAVDRRWGGFRQSQKFPTPVRWRFLLHHYQAHGGEDLEAVLRLTLDRIADGGIRDQLGGGFHRYTVEPTWLVPHFEIMLYDNAQLAELYLEAASILDDPAYLDVGTGVLDFLIREMRAPGGGIHSAFDADSGGEEGAYYVWTPEEIEAVAGPQDGPPLAMLLGATADGNFEGSNVLTRREPAASVAARFDRPEAEVAALVDIHRPALLAARADRVAPALDPKIVTAWNGLALGAFARGYALTGDARYLDTARGIADFLWTRHRDARGRLCRASTGGVTAADGILDDYAFFAEGLIDLYQADGDGASIERAIALTDLAESLFADADGYFMTAADVEAPLGRRRDLHDSVEPSGIAALLRARTRLAALAGNLEARDDVARILENHAGLLGSAGLETAWWMEVLSMHVSGFRDVVIAGDPGAPATDALLAAYWRVQPARAVLARIGTGGPDETISGLLPALRGKTAPPGEARAYVCRFGACDAPAVSAAELLSILAREPGD